MTRRLNIVGQRYGRLIVIEHEGERLLCRCDCGAIKRVRVASVRSGLSTSCGCLRREASGARAKERMTVHGHNCKGKETRTHVSWRSMIQRCTNPKADQWADYGGRGIKVCDRWLESFENFLADMGERPNGMTLDRRDNERGYCKDNCRWASPKEQQRNRRTCRLSAEFVRDVHFLNGQNWRSSAIAIALHASHKTVAKALAMEVC